jgi:hypothetical protein
MLLLQCATGRDMLDIRESLEKKVYFRIIDTDDNEKE